MANAGRLDKLAAAYGIDTAQDRMSYIYTVLAELDEFHPGVWGHTNPLGEVLADVLAAADENGGRIPATCPPLGPTLEAAYTRDASVPMPPEHRPVLGFTGEYHLPGWPLSDGGTHTPPTPAPVPAPATAPAPSTPALVPAPPTPAAEPEPLTYEERRAAYERALSRGLHP
jgi:hypothetical protein